MASHTTTVVFRCQACNQALKLDPSLKELDFKTFKELTIAADTGQRPKYEQDAASQDEPQATETPIVSQKIELPAEKAKLLNVDTRLQAGNTGNDIRDRSTSLHISTQVSARLFDILSENTNVDHPLCEECTDSLLDRLDEELGKAEVEHKEYSDFLNLQLAVEDGSGIDDVDKLAADITKLEEEEAELIAELAKVESERSTIKENTEKRTADVKQLELEEENYWKEYNEFQRQLEQFYEEQESVETRLEHAKVQLDKLRKTNIYNDAFHIWHDGHFGTINNFRLGRLPSIPVEWNEINAAWGQTVLLLDTLASKLHIKFARYRLIPGGSFSRIEKTSDGRDLPLFGSGGFKLFYDKKFDEAMVAFLDCLNQFKDTVESQEQSFQLPYKINGDKIGDSHGDLSIKIQFNQEETWTRALKYMLTNLKWCLAWVCKQMMGEGGRPARQQSHPNLPNNSQSPSST